MSVCGVAVHGDGGGRGVEVEDEVGGGGEGNGGLDVLVEREQRFVARGGDVYENVNIPER